MSLSTSLTMGSTIQLTLLFKYALLSSYFDIIYIEEGFWGSSASKRRRSRRVTGESSNSILLVTSTPMRRIAIEYELPGKPLTAQVHAVELGTEELIDIV